MPQRISDLKSSELPESDPGAVVAHRWAKRFWLGLRCANFFCGVFGNVLM